MEKTFFFKVICVLFVWMFHRSKCKNQYIRCWDTFFFSCQYKKHAISIQLLISLWMWYFFFSCCCACYTSQYNCRSFSTSFTTPLVFPFHSQYFFLSCWCKQPSAFISASQWKQEMYSISVQGTTKTAFELQKVWKGYNEKKGARM